jgi:hypothetical protein
MDCEPAVSIIKPECKLVTRLLGEEYSVSLMTEHTWRDAAPRDDAFQSTKWELPTFVVGHDDLLS